MLMSDDEPREPEKNLGVFLNPTDLGGGGFLVPMNDLNVGPGQPGTGDDWQFPTDPAEATEGGDAPAPEQAPTDK